MLGIIVNNASVKYCSNIPDNFDLANDLNGLCKVTMVEIETSNAYLVFLNCL